MKRLDYTVLNYGHLTMTYESQLVKKGDYISRNFAGALPNAFVVNKMLDLNKILDFIYYECIQ